MKQRYSTLCLSFILSITISYSQTVNQIYDHTASDLTELHNMPFDETRLLVVVGYSFSSNGIEFNELDLTSNQLVNIPFANVDTILSNPEFKDDKLFFEGSINGLGRELVAYDGASTYFFDFNSGPGDSDPEIIEFENEIYVIASDGNVRQLYKYAGGTSFDQISDESVDDVVSFIASRGDTYYYVTFSLGNGQSIESTEDNNGVLTHTYIGSTSFQESLEDVVLQGGDIYMLFALYTVSSTSFRVVNIDAGNLLTTHYIESASTLSSGHLLTYDNEILFYRTEPNHAEMLNVSTPQQPLIQVSIDPSQYNLIGGHVVQNDKLFIYGEGYILDVSGPTPVPILEDGSSIQLVPAYELDSAFYFYEINQFTSGQPAGIIEVSSITNQAVRYTVSNDGGFFYYTRPMVENNGELKFIFKTQGALPSTDIYSFSSVLAIDESSTENFVLYPNPSVDDHFSIVLPHPGEMKLLTIDGQLLRAMHLPAGENLVHAHDLASGVYLVEYEGIVQRLFVD